MLKFLTSVEDSIFEALEENLTSYHFAGYEVDWSEDQESEVTCVNTFYASESILNTHLSSSQSNANTDESNTESSQFYQSKTSHGDENDLSTSSAVQIMGSS
ncbi:uncharacterized protein LOC134846730 [Symsagittifera roscoffensis]|uniref:uncharacterized protein LOC134846730 n=1 Tax=Symsagittifera roscoffensis TaxID=84072 RepID=UPI00307C9C3C